MKTALKRALALLLCLSLCLSLIPAAVAEGEEPDGQEQETPILSTDSCLGELTYNMLEDDGLTEPKPGAITDIRVNGRVAAVKLSTVLPAKLVVAVYPDDGVQLLGSGMEMVYPTDSAKDVTIDIDQMPATFVVAAYLLDPDTLEPISEKYISDLYTAEMKDFLDSTTDDYNPDLVLNLDGDTSNNFLVFKSSVLRVTEAEGVNELTDNGDGTYTVYNADAGFLALRAGDSFSYAYESGGQLFVKALSVETEGTTVTVTRDQTATLLDMFDFVKLRGESDVDGASFDSTDMDPGVSFAGFGELSSPEPTRQTLQLQSVVTREDSGAGADVYVDKDAGRLLVQTRGVEIGESVEMELVNYEIDKPGIKGEVKVNFTATMEVYVALLRCHCSLTGELVGTASLNVDKSVEKALNLGSVCFPLGTSGVKITVPIALLFRLEAKADINAEFRQTVGFLFDTLGGYTDLSTEPSFTFNQQYSASVFLGFRIGLMLSDVLELVAGEIEVDPGLQVDVTVKGPGTQDSGGDTRHVCAACLTGEVTAQCYSRLKLSLLWGLLKKDYELPALAAELADFYYSFDYLEGGWGTTCPHIEYKTEITVLTQEGEALQYAQVYAKEAGRGEQTDEDGVAVLYLPSGSYGITAVAGGRSAFQVVNVGTEPKSITMTLPAPIEETEDEDAWNQLYEANWQPGVVGDSSYDPDTYTLTIYAAGAWNGEIVNLDEAENACDEDGNEYGTIAAFERYYIEHLVLSPGVTGVCAFLNQNQNSLQTISVPSTLTWIGAYSFTGCRNLRSVNFPSGVLNIGTSAFENCASLKTVDIDAYTFSIGDQAFAGCTSLESVKLNSSRPFYCYNMFKDCDKLKSAGPVGSGCDIEYSWNKSVFEMDFFDERMGCGDLTDVIVPDGVTEIMSHQPGVFYGAATPVRRASWTSVTIPDSVVTIGQRALWYCTALESVELPEHLTVVGEDAFRYCSALKSVAFPDGLQELGSFAFDGCTALESVRIPADIARISGGTFRDCPKLKSAGPPGSGCDIEFGWSNTDFPVSFAGGLNCDSLTKLIVPNGVIRLTSSLVFPMTAEGWSTRLSEVVLPDSLGVIGSEAFRDCTALTQLTIPTDVTVIGDEAFRSSGLTSLSLPDKVYWIGHHAFQDCAALSQIDISDSVNHLGDGCFNNCTALTSVEIGSGMSTIYENTFNGCENLQSVIIPASVGTIQIDAFKGCGRLNAVYYGGTAAQWDDIAIESTGNGPLLGASKSFAGGDDPDGLLVSSGQNSFRSDGLDEIPEEDPDKTEAPGEEPSEENAGETPPAENAAAPADSGAGPGEPQDVNGADVYNEDADGENPKSEDVYNEDADGEKPDNEDMYNDGADGNDTDNDNADDGDADNEDTDGGDVYNDDAEQPEEEPEIEFLAAYTGVSTPDGNQLLANFTGLLPGGDYLLLIVADAESDPFAAGNLLYIAQSVADENGAITLGYLPREASAQSSALACGPSSLSVRDAAFTIYRRSGGVTELSVVYGGKTLTQRTDYIYTVETVDDKFVVTVHGCGDYAGKAVLEAEKLEHTRDGADCVCVLPATSTEGGQVKMTYTCPVCGAELDEETISPAVTVLNDAYVTAAEGLSLWVKVTMMDTVNPDNLNVVLTRADGENVSIPMGEGVIKDGAYQYHIPVPVLDLFGDVVVRIVNQSGDDRGMRYRFDPIERIKAQMDDSNGQVASMARSTNAYLDAAKYYFTDETLPEGAVDMSMPPVFNNFAVKTTGIKPRGCTGAELALVCGSLHSLRVYYSFDGKKDPSAYTCTVDGEAAALTQSADGARYLELTDIKPQDLANPHSFKIAYGQDEFSISASALGYAWCAHKQGGQESVYLGRSLFDYMSAATALANSA